MTRVNLLDKAVRILSFRSHSRRELAVKLARHGSGEAVEGVLNRLEELGYLDDKQFAWDRAWIRRKGRLWGNQRITSDLRARGIATTLIEQTLERLDRELSETSCLDQLVTGWLARKGTPDNAKELKKLYDRCVRQGYPPDMVRTRLQPFFSDVTW